MFESWMFYAIPLLLVLGGTLVYRHYRARVIEGDEFIDLAFVKMFRAHIRPPSELPEDVAEEHAQEEEDENVVDAISVTPVDGGGDEGADGDGIQSKLPSDEEKRRYDRFCVLWQIDELFLVNLGVMVFGIYELIWSLLAPLLWLRMPVFDSALLRDVLMTIVPIVLFFNNFRRVTPATLLVRQFLFGYRTITNCVAFVRGTSTVLISGTVDVQSTPGKGQPGALTSQTKVRLVENADVIGKTLKFYFRLRVAWRFDIYYNPVTVVETWIDDFRENGAENAVKHARDQVMELVAAYADQFLQRMYIEEVLEERQRVNQQLEEHLRASLRFLGVYLEGVAIEDVLDQEGNYLQLREEAAIAATDARMRIQAAKAEQTARIAESNANLAATKVEQENIKQANRVIRIAAKSRQAVEGQLATNTLQLPEKELDLVERRGWAVFFDRLRRSDPQLWEAVAQLVPALRDPTLVVGDNLPQLLMALGKVRTSGNETVTDEPSTEAVQTVNAS